MAGFWRGIGQALRLASAPETASSAVTINATEFSQTGPQLISAPSSFGTYGELPEDRPAPLATYRRIRKHPTVALARMFRTAPCVDNEWGIQQADDAPEGAADFIRQQMFPIRTLLVRTAIEAFIDYGWTAYEKVFTRTPEGRIGLKKIKPLLNDLTKILIQGSSGAIAGIRNEAAGGGTKVDLPVDYALVVYKNVEGTQWYGTPDLENARNPYTWWVECNDGARRYDKMQAGSHWVIKYPFGRSSLGGTQIIDNAKLAAEMLKGLVASGSITLPKLPVDGNRGDDPSLSNWDVDLLSDSTPRQASFTDRLKYLDSLLCRAVLVTERSITEGQFGTKAESEAQADVALKNIAQDDRDIVQFANWYVVDQLLALNWGDEARGKVWLVAAPLADEKLAMYRALFSQAMQNPAAFIELFNVVDWTAISQKLGLPVHAEVGELDDGGSGDTGDGGQGGGAAGDDSAAA